MRLTARQVETSLTQPISTPTARATNSLVSSFGAIARVSYWPRHTPTLRPATIPIRPGNHGKSMMQALEASLKRLQTDYIDLYWVHIWDGITPVEEVMRGLDDLVRQGKVLYIGISDAPAWWIAQANTLTELRGWTQFIGLQIEYSLIERTVERELIPMSKALNVGVLAWSPLARGVLSGKYHGEGKADGGRMTNEGMKESLPEEQRATRII